MYADSANAPKIAGKPQVMAKDTAGRLGGMATRDTHLTLCPLCGTPVKNGYFTGTGRKGGQATLDKKGRSFYSQIGRLGGRGNKRNGRDSTFREQVPAEEAR